MKSAKLFIAVLLAAIMALSFALPALADTNVGTSVTVSSSTGTAPAVLALWAHDGGNGIGSSAFESADMTAPHGTNGIQIMPTQGYQVTHDITFVAIVTDANGVNNLRAELIREVMNVLPEDEVLAILPDTIDGLKKHGINGARNSGGILAELGKGESGQIEEPYFSVDPRTIEDSGLSHRSYITGGKAAARYQSKCKGYCVVFNM